MSDAGLRPPSPRARSRSRPASRGYGPHLRRHSSRRSEQREGPGPEMYDDETLDLEQRKRRRRRGLIVLLLSLCVGSLGAGAFSLAIFTDTDASSGSFTTGTIDIATSPSVLFTVAAIMPGDSGSATLNVANNGSGQLRYAIVTS